MNQFISRWSPAVLLVIAGSSRSLAAEPFPAMLEPSSLNGTNGFVCRGIDALDQSGRSVSSAGEVNGDGIDDIIIGAKRGDPIGQTDAGESYVVFGRAVTIIPHCLEDLNQDDVIDTADLGILISQFGTPGPGADINNDEVVDTADLGILIGAFGTICP